jgi:hypothetical protein
MDAGRIVIACYRPKAGHEKALRALVQGHHATLRSVGLVTDRAPITMQAGDGSFVEVFEWASRDAILAAHENPVVLGMWEAFGKVSDYVPVAQISEASQLFSEFAPLAAGSAAAQT